MKVQIKTHIVFDGITLYNTTGTWYLENELCLVLIGTMYSFGNTRTKFVFYNLYNEVHRFNDPA